MSTSTWTAIATSSRRGRPPMTPSYPNCSKNASASSSPTTTCSTWTVASRAGSRVVSTGAPRTAAGRTSTTTISSLWTHNSPQTFSDLRRPSGRNKRIGTRWIHASGRG
uniref:(northern house mosquito) hypothetical protein n=1 Tax=Culex pipiens TaxID=7175 RepID=A0A8D8KGT0_CULPI